VGVGAEWLVRGVMRLVDRRAECGKLDGLVEAVCAGQSRALVLSGEAGVGKSALLQYLIRRPVILLAGRGETSGQTGIPFDWFPRMS
jgi:hypothetical protein